MPLELLTIACLTDNYAFLVGNPVTKEAALVDVPEAAPINAALARKGWHLRHVLLTHHHWDHIDGLPDLANLDGVQIIGAAADAHRLPRLDIAIAEGDVFKICGEDVQVIDVPGHTIGHVAYYLPGSGMVFTADSLMAMGCGRLFEGTAAQMWDSLQKLRALPDETLVCSGHEYTQSNARFALSLEPDNPGIISALRDVQTARDRGEPTVPTLLKSEKMVNPFLRADDALLQGTIGMKQATARTVFAEIRARKDRF